MPKLSAAVLSVLIIAICAYLGQIWNPAVLSNQRIQPDRQYILFDAPNLNTNLGLAIAGKNIEALAGKKRYFWLPVGTLSQRYVTFYQVRYNRQTVWVSPTLQCDKNGNGQLVWNAPSPYGIYICILCLAGAVYFLLVSLFGKNSHTRSDAMLPHIALLLCLRLAFLFWRIETYGTYISISGDENGYFALAYALFCGQLPETMHFTMGLPLLYMPLILLTGAGNFLEMGWQFQLINSVIFASVVLALVYLCAYLLTRSPIAAMSAALFWLCCCCLALPLQVGTIEIEGIQLFFIPQAPLTQYLPADSVAIYFSNHFWAFHSLSDHVALLPLLLSLSLLLLPIRPAWTIASGCCFGLALLIRMNNIIFWPLFLLLFAVHHRKLSALVLFRYLFWFSLSAALCYLPQLLLNWWVLGAPWRTPYHNQDSLYFSLTFLPQGGRFFLQIFFQIYLCVLCLSPLLISNRYAIAIWGLVFVPLAFYCCYSCYGNIRFALPSLVFTTLVIGIAADEIVKRWGKRTLLAGVIFFFLCLFDLIPRHFPVKGEGGLFYFTTPELRGAALVLASTVYCFWLRQPWLALVCSATVGAWLVGTWHLLALLIVVMSIVLLAKQLSIYRRNYKVEKA